jgi:hypothetical protein
MHAKRDWKLYMVMVSEKDRLGWGDMGCRAIACFYMSLRELEGDSGDEQLISRQWRDHDLAHIV